MTTMPPFDEAASSALAIAKVEAGLRGQSIGTEHLLLALTGDAGSDACSILHALGASAEAVRAAVGALMPDKCGTDRPLRPTVRARVAVDVAVRCAGRLGASTTSPRHLLYGLAAEGDGLAARALRTRGVTAPAVDRLLVPLPALASTGGFTAG